MKTFDPVVLVKVARLVQVTRLVDLSDLDHVARGAENGELELMGGGESRRQQDEVELWDVVHVGVMALESGDVGHGSGAGVGVEPVVAEVHVIEGR